MKKALVNPFPVSGYRGADFFCDRQQESQNLASALLNQRNVTLISPRRMGKTGLIHHVFQHIKAEYPDYHCFYIDIFPTQNMGDFASVLARATVGKLDDFSQATLRRVVSLLKSFRPRFSIDPHSGAPEMILDIACENPERGLEEIFTYIKDSDKRCCIAIDEFQQVASYPEKGMEALLRSYIQHLPNVSFVFAGSEKHLMDEMFSSAKRPFYQAAQKMVLGTITVEHYCEFACQWFAVAGRKLPEELFNHIYNMLSGHTWYVQLVLNTLYGDGAAEIDAEEVERVIASILRGEEATYKTYCKMLTAGQLDVLRAVAIAGEVVSPGQSDFLRKHGLGAASSVRLAVKALLDKSLLLQNEDGGYSVYDRFFGLWLARTAL